MSDDIDRSRVEIRRLIAESDKFVAEQRKLMAEAAKFDRDRVSTLVLAIAAALGALTGFTTVLAKLMGW